MYSNFNKSQKDFYMQIEPLDLGDIEINDQSNLSSDNKIVLEFRIEELNKIKKLKYDFWFESKINHKEEIKKQWEID